MSLPQTLEVAIGLALIYYILGAIVSLLTQIVMESLETRGSALEQYLKQIAGAMTPELTNQPQLKALRPIRYAHWWNILGAGTRAKKLERIPVETLVDAFFDLTGLSSKGALTAAELMNVMSKLPDSEGKQALLRWVGEGVTAVSELRDRTSAYFAGLLNQAAETFRSKARSFVILCSIVLTLLFGTDSIQLARDLWENAALRSVAAEQAQVITSQPEGPVHADSLLNELGALAFRIGWWRTEYLPLPTSSNEWLAFVLFKLAGLGITAAAVSQGSSFWYDVLKKFVGSPSSSAAGIPADSSAAG